MTPAAQHRRRLIVSATVTVGVFVSLAAGWQVQRAEHNRTRAEFARRATAQAALSIEKLRLYEEMILGLRDLFLGSSNVTRTEFAAVAREILQRRPGVQALEWVPLVPAAARAEMEARAARETGRPFQFVRHDPELKQLRPVGERPEYLPILYVEPLAGNEIVLGYELTEALTRDTLQQARRERRPLITPLVQLTQTNNRVMGVIFIAPIFRPLPENRFAGFVQGVFLAKTMLAQAHQPPGPDRALDVIYTDTSGPGGKSELIYRNRGGTDATEQASIPDSTLDFYQQTIDLGGRQWAITIYATPDWLAGQRTMLPWLMLGGALFSTCLAALFINQLLRRTGDIEREVAARTDDLRRTQQLLEDDIRRRTEAEQALMASEVRLQAILDHSPNSIFVKDLAGRYVLVSRQHARMWNRPAGDFIGRDDTELFPPDIATRFRESDQQMLSAGTAIKYELTVNLPGGTNPITAIVQKFPLLDAEGRIYGMCGISTDITDRKQAEQDKIAMERKLLAAQKLESLGVLAGGIAHDFNNILTSVLANASLARHDAAAGRPVERNLTQIELAARRAADLCQQMLAYAGKGKLASDRLDLSELVRGTAALLEVTLSKSTKLELQLATGLPPVLADPTQLRQIVMNLVINAADAITGRPGLITVTTFTRAADAALLRSALGNPDLPPGTYVGLEVTDDGSGMTPETIARIFEPFFTTKFSGRGLGLSAVLGIVQGHRGALFVESTPGQGSTFRLLLPATSGQAVASAPPFPDAGPAALRGTVLVVDDEEAVRSIAATVLEIHGATSLTAASGDEALDLLRTHGGKISLVLLDLTMPGINGEETLRRMRMLGARQPVILMSGYSETETMQRSANLGVAGFIQKPFEVATLLAKTRPFLS